MRADPPYFPLGSGGIDFNGLKKHLDAITWKGWLTTPPGEGERGHEPTLSEGNIED